MSPVKVKFWRDQLVSFPDQQFAALIINGLERGFRIGFRPNLSKPLKAARFNLLSTEEHPQEVTAYITKDVDAKCVLLIGSPSQARRLGVHFGPLGIIPKKGRPNQRWLIMDLSIWTQC